MNIQRVTHFTHSIFTAEAAQVKYSKLKALTMGEQQALTMLGLPEIHPWSTGGLYYDFSRLAKSHSTVLH